MRNWQLFSLFLLLSFFAVRAPGQLISAPEPQSAIVTGTVTDADGGVIPAATVTADAPTPDARRTAVATGEGLFTLRDLHPNLTYHLTVSATGFGDWVSPAIVLTPGQQLNLTDVKLVVAIVETAVSAESPDQVALEQVHAAEKQRAFGVIPNFYVVYDKQFVPLPAKLKYQLALRASTDPVTIVGAAFLAGVNQAADTPAYVQGAKGYGQRFGAVYAGSVSDILIGGAVLPSLLHQDPRYFYQGTGTKKSRALHAISAPFVAKGDNGNWQFNYSSIGGDLASSALSTLYLPATDRDAGTVLGNALITTGGRIANALAQEFLLHRVTSGPKN
jgi:hypothetical protein